MASGRPLNEHEEATYSDGLHRCPGSTLDCQGSLGKQLGEVEIIPLPINIDHAFNNLCFDRKGEYVAKKLISHLLVEAEWPEVRKLKLPTHGEHFYTVDRYEFTGSVHIETQQHCHICMLVKGESLNVTVNNKTETFHYAETFVIPAAAGSYELQQKGGKQVCSGSLCERRVLLNYKRPINVLGPFA